MTKLKS